MQSDMETVDKLHWCKAGAMLQKYGKTCIFKSSSDHLKFQFIKKLRISYICKISKMLIEILKPDAS